MENNLRIILSGGILPKVLRVWERLGYGRSRSWLYRLLETEFKREQGLNFWQKAKLLVIAVNAVAPERIEMLKDDLFAGLTERDRQRMSFGTWLERFFSKVGEISALAVADKRELLRLKLAELNVLSEVEWI